MDVGLETRVRRSKLKPTGAPRLPGPRGRRAGGGFLLGGFAWRRPGWNVRGGSPDAAAAGETKTGRDDQSGLAEARWLHLLIGP